MNETELSWRAEIPYIVNALQQGEVIAYPTEAVYGLGCDPDNSEALSKLLALKKRSPDKGLILVAENYTQLLPYVDDAALTAEQRKTIFTTWPGPVTWLIPARKTLSPYLTGRFSTLAVRVSAQPQVQALCLAFGKPLVSTSANRSGETPCRDAECVRMRFGSQLPVLSGDTGGRARPSEIRDALTGALMRKG